MVLSSSRYDHITPLVRQQLHWLKVKERIDFKLALLVYTCQHGAAPTYIADELSQPANFKARRRLRSASSPSLTVGRTRLSTIGDRGFAVAAFRVWNSLPQYVTSATYCLFLQRVRIACNAGTAVLATSVSVRPSVCPSFRHTLVLCREE